MRPDVRQVGKPKVQRAAFQEVQGTFQGVCVCQVVQSIKLSLYLVKKQRNNLGEIVGTYFIRQFVNPGPRDHIVILPC